MCGVTGFWLAAPLSADEAETRVLRMRDALVHRGPDDAATWHDRAAGLSLGFRRLAIVDLSPEGRQPMTSATGRYVIGFNGEVFNHAALRKELDSAGAAPAWRGTSDTETMLAAVEAWGIEGALERFVGMFALALWDRRDRVLTLVRDRVGIKPLYVAQASDGAVLFGSELSALVAYPRFTRELDPDVAASYLRFGCVPAPHAIYRHARKLRPGTMLQLRTPRLSDASERTWWSARDVVAAGLADPFRGDESEAAWELEALLRESVRLRMLADVPLGAFLSGGVDSSTVVAMMQAQSERPVRTFTIGNETSDYDEAEGAAAVAKHLGTEHTALTVRASDALALAPTLFARLDEPFADASLLPTFLVSELARRHVTVALSGDGGDELFGGYNRHVFVPSVWRAAGVTPSPLRGVGSRALTFFSRDAWNRAFDIAAPLLPAVRLPGDKLHKLARAFAAPSPEALYETLCSQWEDPVPMIRGATREAPAPVPTIAAADLATRLMLADLTRYLPDDILTKVDRASMAVSLEARVPILDHRLIAFAFRLPSSMKIQNGVGKVVLRRVLHRYVPRELVERPKMGFGVPIDAWLRGPLRDWADALLDPTRLRDDGLVNPSRVRHAWDELRAGRGDWAHPLWAVLVLNAWWEAQRRAS